MKKISGILSSSPRVTSVDLKESPPARPGSPNVGQTQGAVRIGDRVRLSERAKELAAQDTMMKINPREMGKAKIAEQVTKDFFVNRLSDRKPIAEEILEVAPVISSKDNQTDVSLSGDSETSAEINYGSENLSETGNNLSVEA